VRRGEGKHLVRLTQLCIDPVLQHRSAVAGTQPLAVNDAHAVQPALARLAQEGLQGRRCLRQRAAVQIDLLVDVVLATAQPSQHQLGDAGATEYELIAGLQLIEIGALHRVHWG
jgi:hypothetical protein